MKLAQMKLLRKRVIARDVYEMVLQGSIAKEIQAPGQFLHVKTGPGSELLRRPISISTYNQSESTCTMIFRIDGKGTANLASVEEGENLDVLGPLGNGFPLEKAMRKGSAILVGGGIGVPPLYGLSQALVSRGVQVRHILGFANEQAVFYEKVFSELGQTAVTTDDGSYGHHGLVTDLLDESCGEEAVIYACGPTPMLRALNTLYGSKDLYLSLEQRMGCGIGACFACVCETIDPKDSKGYRKICSDGPVFKGNEVVL